MFSQRGLFHLAHSVHDMQEITRRGYSNYLNGIDAEILNQDQVAKKIPHINAVSYTHLTLPTMLWV